MLELGETFGNISRSHYYDFKNKIQEDGLEELLEKSRKVPSIGNRVAPDIEQNSLGYSLKSSTHGTSPNGE